MTSDFKTLPLPDALQDNLASLGFTAMTPIQAASLPHSLAGQDVIAKAQTGSGKTVAFTLPLLSRLNASMLQVQALVLCPTRELADQVAKEIRRLARSMPNVKVITLCGGMPLRPQAISLEHGAHIVVGTPGRLVDHLHKGTLNLRRLQTLVLDEADRMLDMGFADEVDAIIEACPKRRQTLLFSATYPESIESLSQHIQHAPIQVEVEPIAIQTPIAQHAFPVTDNASKQDALPRLLAHFQPESVVIFCNTRADCEALAQTLQRAGMSAAPLHGEMEQRDRDRILVQFANRSCPILIATDMAARGLDIKELPLVINYELPHDPEVYVHRIGRTGRAGSSGQAASLFAPGSQTRRLAQIESFQQQTIPQTDWKTLTGPSDYALTTNWVTLNIDSGRKHKLRPGDILGALTVAAGIPGTAIGKIDLFDLQCYVAVDQAWVKQALSKLAQGTIKGRSIRIRRV